MQSNTSDYMKKNKTLPKVYFILFNSVDYWELKIIFTPCNQTKHPNGSGLHEYDIFAFMRL